MILCCVIKPLVAWHAERVGTISRERCGGECSGAAFCSSSVSVCCVYLYVFSFVSLCLLLAAADLTLWACHLISLGQGYLSANRLGHVIGFAHAGMTAEGDNRVLMQKVTKEVMDFARRGNVEPRSISAFLWVPFLLLLCRSPFGPSLSPFSFWLALLA